MLVMTSEREQLSRRVAAQCRVVVDNDYAGDPDGILALAHHLLSPSNRVLAVTSSFLNPRFVSPPATAGATAADGARLATALLTELGLASPPPVAIGAEEAGGGRSAAAEAIVAAAREESDLPLYLVCGGPLTNVAAALELDPGIVERLTLIWIGGSLDPEAFEYNRDTDLSAAEAVFAVAGLEIHQFPLETYRRCAYGIAELEADLPATGRLGAWLYDCFSSPPEWIRLGGVWPLGDSPPVLITALTAESSTRSATSGGVTVYSDVDMRLLVGDLLAKLRLHEQRRS
jgi:purine nucleosidase